MYPTLEEAAPLLSSLPRGATFRLRFTVFPGEAERGPDYRLTGKEFLVLCIADWLFATTSITESEQALLLAKLRDALADQVQWLEAVEEGQAVRPFQLGLADQRFATWPGRTDWWDIAHTKTIERLDRPPLVTVALDVNVLWFLSLRQLESMRKKEHANEPGVGIQSYPHATAAKRR